MMESPKRQWFTLARMASEWQLPQEDLLHLAAQGQLRLSVIADYWYLDYFRYQENELIKDHRVIYQGALLRLDAGIAKQLELEGVSKVDRARWAENEAFNKVTVSCPSFSRNHPGGHALPEAPPVISKDDIVISAEECERFKKKRTGEQLPANIETGATKRKPGRPKKTDRIEHYLKEITTDARQVAKGIISPTNDRVINQMEKLEKWKGRFSRRDWNKIITNPIWQE